MREPDASMTVVMKAIPKQRPRFNFVTKKKPYTPKRTMTAEQIIRDKWVEKYKNVLFIDEPIKLSITFEIYRAAGHFKKDGSLSTQGLRTPHPIHYPDLDNIVKLVGDGLNQVAWDDDRRITEVRCRKVWAKQNQPPRIIIKIWRLLEKNQ